MILVLKYSFRVFLSKFSPLLIPTCCKSCGDKDSRTKMSRFVFWNSRFITSYSPNSKAEVPGPVNARKE